MPIRVICNHCESELEILDGLAGATRQCPGCDHEFVVPGTPREKTPTISDVVLLEDDVPETPIPVSATPEAAAAVVAPLTGRLRFAPGYFPDDDGADDYIPWFIAGSWDDLSDRKTPLPGNPLDPHGKLAVVPSAAAADLAPVKPKPKFNPYEQAIPKAGSPADAGPAQASPTRPRPQAPVLRAPLESLDTPASPTRPVRSAGQRPSPVPIESLTPVDPQAHDRAQAAREYRQALRNSTLQPPQPPKKSRPAAAGLLLIWSEYGVKALLVLGGVGAICLGLYFVSTTLVSSTPTAPPLGYVSGKLTYNGRPVSDATVYLQLDTSESGKKSKSLPPSVGKSDADGMFQMMLSPGVPGVPQGVCHLWVELPGSMKVPEEFTREAKTTREIVAGNQPLELHLSSAPRKK